MPTSTATWSAFRTSWKGAATRRCSTWSMRRPAPCTAQTPQMPFSVHQQRRPSGEPVRRHQEGQRADGAYLQPSLRAARPPGCASSPCTARGAARTWRSSCFTEAILAGQPIDVFNYGKMRRDFTYIDDIVEGVVRVLDHAPQPDPAVMPGERPDPGDERRPVPALQHRQQPAGGAPALHRGAGSVPGENGPRSACCRSSPATCRRPVPTSTT